MQVEAHPRLERAGGGHSQTHTHKHSKTPTQRQHYDSVARHDNRAGPAPKGSLYASDLLACIRGIGILWRSELGGIEDKRSHRARARRHLFRDAAQLAQLALTILALDDLGHHEATPAVQQLRPRAALEALLVPRDQKTR